MNKNKWKKNNKIFRQGNGLLRHMFWKNPSLGSVKDNLGMVRKLKQETELGGYCNCPGKN